MERVEYELPDPDEMGDDNSIEIEEPENKHVVGGPALGVVKEVEDEDEDEDEVDIEIVDDVPPEDRNRTPSEPPEDVTDDELKDYSKKVQNRIKRFNKSYHDERRAKEAAQRERNELEAFSRKIMEENQHLKGTVNKNQFAMIEQAKKAVAGEVELAKRQYREAYESGDTDALVDAQEALTAAKIRFDKVEGFKPRPLQQQPNGVQQQEQPTPANVDERAVAWAKENTWYGSDDEMTSFALGVHTKLVNGERIDPRSDTYYERLNARMREVFPDQFEDSSDEVDAQVEEPKPRKRKSTNVVASGSRSTAPKKIKLTASAVKIANRLGVPLDLYAEMVAAEERKTNG